MASGSGGFSGHLVGDGLALMTAATWAGYSVLITPLMRRYSPFRISSLVLLFGWIPLAITGAHQTASQSFHFSNLMWICFAYAVIGPLFLTNILWFTAISRVGPSRASLFSNMQPLFGVFFALLLLRRAPDALGGGRRRGDPGRRPRRALAAAGSGATR